MFTHMLAAILVVAAQAVGASAGASGVEPAQAPTEASALEVSGAAMGRQVGDHTFRDSGGKPVRLADFRGKPLVISFVYTSCDHTCPQTTQSVARAVSEAVNVVGADAFAVVTIGFDTRMDTETAMRAFARANGLNGMSNWSFLSGDLPAVIGVAEETGFQFWRSTQGLDHLAQTTLVDRDGRVSTQVYGSNFPSYQLVDPLKELVSGSLSGSIRLSSLLERVRLFCTTYDAKTDRYRVNYGLYIEATIGLLSLISVALFLAANWRRGRKKIRKKDVETC